MRLLNPRLLLLNLRLLNPLLLDVLPEPGSTSSFYGSTSSFSGHIKPTGRKITVFRERAASSGRDGPPRPSGVIGVRCTPPFQNSS